MNSELNLIPLGLVMNNTFKELSEKAAQMEREGNVSAARRCWKKAEDYAESKENAHWCQVRAEFCLSRHAMQTDAQ